MGRLEQCPGDTRNDTFFNKEFPSEILIFGDLRSEIGNVSSPVSRTRAFSCQEQPTLCPTQPAHTSLRQPSASTASFRMLCAHRHTCSEWSWYLRKVWFASQACDSIHAAVILHLLPLSVVAWRPGVSCTLFVLVRGHGHIPPVTPPHTAPPVPFRFQFHSLFPQCTRTSFVGFLLTQCRVACAQFRLASVPLPFAQTHSTRLHTEVAFWFQRTALGSVP